MLSRFHLSDCARQYLDMVLHFLSDFSIHATYLHTFLWEVSFEAGVAIDMHFVLDLAIQFSCPQSSCQIWHTWLSLILMIISCIPSPASSFLPCLWYKCPPPTLPHFCAVVRVSNLGRLKWHIPFLISPTGTNELIGLTEHGWEATYRSLKQLYQKPLPSINGDYHIAT